MTNTQRLTIRASEIRQRLNEIAGLATDALTDAIRTETDTLSNEYRDTETQLRAALTAEGESGTQTRIVVEDAEARERRTLRAKTGIGDFLAAAAGKRDVTGPAAEYRDSLKVDRQGPGGGVLMPLDVFEQYRPEVRAVTPGVTAVQTAAPTMPYVFERSALASLGFVFPMVASGQANYPVVTTGAPSGSVAKGGDAPVTAAAFRLDTRLPKRIAGQFEIRAEDSAVFPDMDRALRESLMDSMSNALDETSFSGDGTSGALDGLFNQATDVAAAGSVETFVTGVARYAALVDGQYAYGWKDCRAVIGSATFARYAGQFQSNGDVSLFDYLMSKLGSLRVSNRVPAVASTAQKAIVTLNGPMAPLRVPTWSGVELIIDPYTKAGQGVKVCTATMLVGDPHVPYATSQLKELHPKLS